VRYCTLIVDLLARFASGNFIVERLVASPPTPKVALAIRRSPAGILLRAEALLTGPGFDNRAVDREGLIAEVSGSVRLVDDSREEGAGDVAAQQALASW